MDNVIKQQISIALKEYMTANGVSQSEIAIRTGVNKGYICNISQGVFTYGNKNTVLADRHFNAIARYIGFKMDRTYWGLVKTNQFKKIITSLTDAQMKGIVKTVVGQSGCGKTYSVNAYYEKNKTNNVYKITVSMQQSNRQPTETDGQFIVWSAQSRQAKRTGANKRSGWCVTIPLNVMP